MTAAGEQGIAKVGRLKASRNSWRGATFPPSADNPSPSASIRVHSRFKLPYAEGVVPYSPGLRLGGATPGSGHIAFPTPQGVVPFVPAGGVRQTRAEWDRVRGCRRGVRPECISHIHAIHTTHTTHSTHRHNHLRGCGALRTHTPGNAAGGATPGFMAESRWDSRRGKARADGHSTRLHAWPAMDSHRHPNRPIQPSWWRHPQPPRLCSRRDRKLCPQG